MNHGPMIFLAAFFALSASWFGYVLTPQIQIGREQQTTSAANSAERYPQNRPGLARQGADVYRASGCAYCHSQQVRQTGVVADVLLLDPGTNLTEIVRALADVGQTNVNPAGLASGLPKRVLRSVSFETGTSAVKALKTAGAKSELQIVGAGPDIARGWGLRRTVGEDFLFDYPVMLGSQRVGPDLANVGRRLPDPNWHLRHLYSPASEVKGSSMPSYKFLFEERKREPGRDPSPTAIPLGDDHEAVPKPEATALVAYLLSLHADVPLWSAPMAAPFVSHAAAASTNSVSTNAPAP